MSSKPVVISDLDPPLRFSGVDSKTSTATGSGPKSKPPVAISIKMNPDLLHQFRLCLENRITPKLIVKDGLYSIKVSNDLIFPCHTLPEHLNVDIYSIKDSKYNGRVSNKLNVITDSKKIKEYTRSLEFKTNTNPTASTDREPTAVVESVRSPSRSPQKSNTPSTSKSSHQRKLAYRIKASDSQAQITQKFLHLLALGPMDESHIAQTLGSENSNLISSLVSDNCQVFGPFNTFIQDDRFPILFREKRRTESTDSDSDSYDDIDSMIESDYEREDVDVHTIPHYILKDKSYKDLKPWEWTGYSKFERTLIVQNIHHALTRIGYSETHPLRRKICNKPESNSSSTVSTLTSSDEDKRSTLGGGFLISGSSKKAASTSTTNANMPFRKSHTDSPKVANKLDLDNKRSGIHTSSNSPSIDTYTPINGQNTSSKNLFAAKRTGPSTSAPTSNSSTAAKRKFSSSSSSYSSDEDKHVKKLKSETYTSPPSSEEMDDGEALATARSQRSGNPTTSRTNVNPISAIAPPDIKSASKRLEYYNNLANKFKLKYKEYEVLYNKLKVPNTSNINKAENKAALLKLFELHNTLSQWKRTLWDYDNEIKSKSKIMNLSKHKKTSASIGKIEKVSPASASKTNKSQSLSPAIAQTINRPQSRGGYSAPASSLAVGNSRLNKAKLSLDY